MKYLNGVETKKTCVGVDGMSLKADSIDRLNKGHLN